MLKFCCIEKCIFLSPVKIIEFSVKLLKIQWLAQLPLFCGQNRQEWWKQKTKTLQMPFQVTLSKLIVDNGLEDLWRRENPDISFTTDLLAQIFWQIFWSRIDRVHPDIKIANKTKINHKMISFTDHYNLITIDRISPK